MLATNEGGKKEMIAERKPGLVSKICIDVVLLLHMRLLAHRTLYLVEAFKQDSLGR